MKVKDLLEKTNIKDSVIDDIDVNPLSLIVSDEFGRRDAEGDSHKRALERVVQLSIGFSSEPNTIQHIVDRYIKVINPQTGNEMKFHSAGGNIRSTTIRFKDEETGDTVYLSLDADAFGFEPSKLAKPQNA